MHAEHWHGTLLNEKRDESGLLYRRNRYYDPATGRFTQEDPIGLAGGVNVYGFAEGDPVSYSDPYGLCPENVCPLDFGGGYRGRVDHFTTKDGVAQHEIHVYRVNSSGVGTAVGVFGKDGWSARHGFDGSDPGVPRAVLAKINGQNVTELRRQGVIRPRGQQDIAGGAYSSGVARLFGRLNSVAAVVNVANVAEYQGQARSLGLNYWRYATARMIGYSHEQIQAEVRRTID